MLGMLNFCEGVPGEIAIFGSCDGAIRGYLVALVGLVGAVFRPTENDINTMFGVSHFLRIPCRNCIFLKEIASNK